MEIDFFGPLLGIKAESSNFDGYAFWSNIQTSLSCNNKKLSYSIPDLGYKPKTYYDFISQAQNIKFPFETSNPHSL